MTSIFNTKTLLCAALCLTIGCSSDDDSSADPAQPTPDAMAPAMDGGVDTDAAPETDAATESDADVPAPDGGTNACTATGFESGEIQTETSGDGWTLIVSNAADDTDLRIESWVDWGGPTEPGTYQLDGINYKDCGLCLLLVTDCDDEGDCSTIYYADQGTVEIRSLDVSEGGTIDAVLTDVVFTEVDVDQETFVSTPVENARTWCLEGEYAGSFEGSIPSRRVGEALPEFTAPDQTDTDVALSSLQGGMSVVLFNGGEWCPPCREAAAGSQALLDEMNAEDDRYDVGMVQLMVDNGEFGVPATLASVTAWAEMYGIEYPVLYGDEIDGYGELCFGDEWAQNMFGIPAFWVVDPQGQIRDFVQGVGQLSSEDVQASFEAFLADNPDWVRGSEAPAMPE